MGITINIIINTTVGNKYLYGADFFPVSKFKIIPPHVTTLSITIFILNESVNIPMSFEITHSSFTGII